MSNEHKSEVKVGQVWQTAYEDDDDQTLYTVMRTSEATTLQGPDLGPDTMICICDTCVLLDPYEWKLIKDVTP